MKYLPLCSIFAFLLFSCGTSSQKEAVMVPPPQVQEIPGVELETMLVTKMSSNNYPQDRVSYIADPVKIFHVYNKFSNMPQGTHQYEYALWPKGSSYTFKPRFSLESAGSEIPIYDFLTGFFEVNIHGTNTQNVWSTIKTWEAVINNGHGEYFCDVYLNGNLINRIEVPIYSNDQVDSLGITRYWLNDEYFNSISIGPELNKLDRWRSVGLKYLEGEVVSVITPADYKGFKRFFAVYKLPNAREEYSLVEVKKQKNIEIRRIKTSDINEVKFHMKQSGDEVYFFNYANNYNTKYNLENGSSGPASAPADVTVPEKGVFPSGKDGLSILKSCEQGGVFLVEKGKQTKLVDWSCDQDLGWAGWSSDGSRVYFDADGAFSYDVSSGLVTQLFYDPHVGDVNVFDFDSQDMIMFTNGTRIVNLGSNLASVNGVGYLSVEFNYDHFYQSDFTRLEAKPDTLKVAFDNQDPLLSVNTGEDMMSFTTEIKQVGKISSGIYNDYDLYRMDLRDDSECKGCESGIYTSDFMVYFLNNADTLVFLESYIDREMPFGKDFFKGNKINIRDAGYALNSFKLFKQAKVVQVLPNTVIDRLLSPDQLFVNDQPLRLNAKKLQYYGDINENFKSIGVSNYGDQVMVLNEEDGSFSVFHPDGSWSIYTYDFSGKPTSTESIDFDNYVQYTDRYCNDSPIDLSNVVKLDKQLLSAIGTYSGRDIYALNNEDVMQAKYQVYKERLEEYKEMPGVDFKSYEDFKVSMPFFFWEDYLGRFVQFTRKDYLTPVACEPILYVYPEESMDVEIAVDSKVKLIASYPSHKDGWYVKAESNGNLVDYKSQVKEHRLFWEGVSDFLPPLKTGFVKHRSEISHFLDEKLTYLGLNEIEIAEFKEAWLADLQEKSYCFITFYDQKYIDQYAPIDIQPVPDQFIRVLMDFKPLEAPVQVTEPVLAKAPERQGYVVVEWGGLKR